MKSTEKITVGDLVTTDGNKTGRVISIEYDPDIPNPYWYEVLCDGIIYCTFSVRLKKKKKQLATLIGITHNQ
jgi:hypothetical protein